MMSKDKRKGGVTRFNVGSDETEIKYNGEVDVISDENMGKVMKYIK